MTVNSHLNFFKLFLLQTTHFFFHFHVQQYLLMEVISKVQYYYQCSYFFKSLSLEKSGSKFHTIRKYEQVKLSVIIIDVFSLG